MNNKGFTLIELLGVIVVLILLALLTTTAITKLLKDAKNDLSDIQISAIESAAKVWGADNSDILPDAGTCSYITLDRLKNEGLLDSKVIDPLNNELMQNIKIKILTTLSSSGKSIVKYEVNPDNIDGCLEIAIKTICYAKNENESGSTTIGTEYNCRVNSNESYDFYVLSKDRDKINLIMKQNLIDNVFFATENSISSYESWYQYIKEVPNAIVQLQNLTTDWNYVPSLNESYTSIYTVNLKGKARLPKVSELTTSFTCKYKQNCSESNCKNYDENEEYLGATSPYYYGCPSWLLGNYWTMDMNTYDAVWAMNTKYNTLDDFYLSRENGGEDYIIEESYYPHDFDMTSGIRPVITVNESSLK